MFFDVVFFGVVFFGAPFFGWTVLSCYHSFYHWINTHVLIIHSLSPCECGAAKLSIDCFVSPFQIFHPKCLYLAVAIGNCLFDPLLIDWGMLVKDAATALLSKAIWEWCINMSYYSNFRLHVAPAAPSSLWWSEAQAAVVIKRLWIFMLGCCCCNAPPRRRRRAHQYMPYHLVVVVVMKLFLLPAAPMPSVVGIYQHFFADRPHEQSLQDR